MRGCGRRRLPSAPGPATMDLFDDACALYESNWRFVDEAPLTPRERRLIERLTRQFGNGVITI